MGAPPHFQRGAQWSKTMRHVILITTALSLLGGVAHADYFPAGTPCTTDIGAPGTWIPPRPLASGSGVVPGHCEVIASWPATPDGPACSGPCSPPADDEPLFTWEGLGCTAAQVIDDGVTIMNCDDSPLAQKVIFNITGVPPAGIVLALGCTLLAEDGSEVLAECPADDEVELCTFRFDTPDGPSASCE